MLKCLSSYNYASVMKNAIKKASAKGKNKVQSSMDKKQGEAAVRDKELEFIKSIQDDAEDDAKYFPEDMSEEEAILMAFENFFGLLDQIEDAANLLTQATAKQAALDELYYKKLVPKITLNNKLRFFILKSLFSFYYKPWINKKITAKEKESLMIHIKVQLQDLTTTAHYESPLFNHFHQRLYNETIQQDLENSLEISIRQYQDYLRMQNIDYSLIDSSTVKGYKELQEKALQAVRQHFEPILGNASLKYKYMPSLPLNIVIDSDIIQDEIKLWQGMERSISDLMEIAAPITTILSSLRFRKLPVSIGAESIKLKEKIRKAIKRKKTTNLLNYFIQFLRFHKPRIKELSKEKVHELNQVLFELLGTIHLHIDELPDHPKYFKRLSLNAMFFRMYDLDLILQELQKETIELRQRYAALKKNNSSAIDCIKKILSE